MLQQPPLADLTERNPRIYSKLQRRYLYASLTPEARLRTVQTHYRFLEQNIPFEIVRTIYSEGGFRVANIQLEEFPPLSLRLFYSDGFEKEGEMGIGLFNDSLNVAIFHLAFTVWKNSPSESELFVGGLQGQKYFNDREFIVQLTRTMHGLRPKALLLFTLQTLADQWKISNIRAISAEQHVYQHWQQRKTIHADYNEFWEENGGQRESDGMYRLPSRATERDPETIPAKKRSIYRKRYSMLATMAQEMALRLSGQVPVPTPAPLASPAPQITTLPTPQ